MSAPLLKFVIGRGNWIDEIRYYTAEISPAYWAQFQPLSAQEIGAIERNVERPLPDDFKEFLRIFGAGRFPSPFYGNVYTPDEFIRGCYGHLYMILGSRDWASDEDHRQFYLTHGRFNPAPDDFTDEALDFEGINLLNLVQFGSNGTCCYHQLHIGKESSGLGYCLLTPERTIEDEAPSFSEGLKKILTDHWLSALRFEF